MGEMTLQKLINDGQWGLEGSVGRAMMGAINDGTAILGKEGAYDYWGTYIPSRYEVTPGTKGSVDYANELRGDMGLDPLTEDQWDAGLGGPEGGIF
jgi:hypothetical protein